MGKSKPHGAKNGTTQSSSARPTDEKRFIRGPVFSVGLGLLSADQRAAVEEAAATPGKMRELYRVAERAGEPSPGTDIRAIRVGAAWLVFHEKAEEVELAQVIDDHAFQQMGVRLTPARGLPGEAVGRP